MELLLLLLLLLHVGQGWCPLMQRSSSSRRWRWRCRRSGWTARPVRPNHGLDSPVVAEDDGGDGLGVVGEGVREAEAGGRVRELLLLSSRVVLKRGARGRSSVVSAGEVWGRMLRRRNRHRRSSVRRGGRGPLHHGGGGGRRGHQGGREW